MQLKKLVIKTIIIFITSLCCGLIAFILAINIGKDEPIILWQNDPLLIPLLGCMIGVFIGWYLSNILIKKMLK